ncbi:hypothetical protein CARUB_v10013895mg [Capsella rubella]|uniref:F-box domain-containing protein n=1 Tax=Capsella rubella TaxID=81985 RepID=R0G5C9_9BRAS|nr:F-box/kelch-repeat protein At3g13680 [Capsella rubella]EOA30752.1 hypothetical protein CARUB_v10013895mg [Capsella rubella]
MELGRMTTMSELPGDVVEEILPKVPLTSLSALRSTCKKWNSLSKNRIVGKAAAVRKQFLGFIMMDYRVCSMRFNLQGIGNDEEFVHPSIKQVGILDKIEISNVFHCDGLLLCVLKDNSRLVVWNPYLGQTRWIQPRDSFHRLDRYALGYDKDRNHKILRIFADYEGRNQVFGYEVFSFRTDSWKAFHLTPDWDIESHQRGMSLKGNAYFLAQEKKLKVGRRKVEDFLLSFDFTRETFGPRLPLPIRSYEADNFVSLSCVGEEQLAVLHQSWGICDVLEICVTNKIDPDAVVWSKFLSSVSGFSVNPRAGSFFIDEEIKVAVVFDLDEDKGNETCRNQTAYIIGQDGYFKSVNVGEARNLGKPDKDGYTPRLYCRPLVCSYVPSLGQLQINNKS